jgi:hypothetical protein
MKRNKLFILLTFCLALFACNDYDGIEVIIVNKIPRGAFAGEEMPHNIGWYEIGLSRNGKEPIEYIWSAGNDYDSYILMSSEIGDKGTLRLTERAKLEGMKLPRPSKKEPPIIGTFGEVWWEKKE